MNVTSRARSKPHPQKKEGRESKRTDFEVKRSSQKFGQHIPTAIETEGRTHIYKRQTGHDGHIGQGRGPLERHGHNAVYSDVQTGPYIKPVGIKYKDNRNRTQNDKGTGIRSN